MLTCFKVDDLCINSEVKYPSINCHAKSSDLCHEGGLLVPSLFFNSGNIPSPVDLFLKTMRSQRESLLLLETHSSGHKRAKKKGKTPNGDYFLLKSPRVSKTCYT